MTVVDKLSFRFRMADEQFARRLYADWDEFCQRCVTDILEKFFSRYDNKDTYTEIDRLDLELGEIPQEEFRNEFSVRLYEVLERNFLPYQNAFRSSQTELPEGREDRETSAQEVSDSGYLLSHAGEKRLENLLHYLEYGFCLPEWDSLGFDLYGESMRFGEQEVVGRIVSLITGKPYIIERLFLQSGEQAAAEIFSSWHKVVDEHCWNELMEALVSRYSDLAMFVAEKVWHDGSDNMIFFSAWLFASTLGRNEKQRYLAAALKQMPRTVLRFIHEASERDGMENLSELLETTHVRRIMEVETERHAEIDVPEYWHGLYGWLLEYYPFNGVPMFGDKRHFHLHLNRSLLSFIRKRTYPAYLSKAELTVQFLLEVFGADHYRTVLDIIYHNQRLNPDGTPAAGDSYAWELHYMLLQLSLVNTVVDSPAPECVARKCSGFAPEPAVGTPEELSALTEPTGAFGKWLGCGKLPDTAKRMLIRRLAKEKPAMLTKWLESRPQRRSLQVLASLIDESALLLLTGRISLQLADTFSSLADLLDELPSGVSWFRGITRDRSRDALAVSILEGIGAGLFPATDSDRNQILQIATLLYRKITGTDISAAVVAVEIQEGLQENESDIAHVPLREFINVVSEQITVGGGTRANTASLPAKPAVSEEGYSALRTLLSDIHIPDGAKRRMLLRWFDIHRGNESEFVRALDSEQLLTTVADILGDVALRQLIMQMASAVSDSCGITDISPAVMLMDWLTGNIVAISDIFSHPVKEVWVSLILSVARWRDKRSRTQVADSVATAVLLLSALSGEKDMAGITDRLIIQADCCSAPSPIAGQADQPVSDTVIPERVSGKRTPGNKAFRVSPEGNTVSVLLIRVREYIRKEKADDYTRRSLGRAEPVSGDNLSKCIPHTDGSGIRHDISGNDLNEVRIVFEKYSDDIAGIGEWLRMEAFTPAQKREIFRGYAGEHPQEATRLIKKSVSSDKDVADLWAGITEKSLLLSVTGRFNGVFPELLTKTIGAVESVAAGLNLFSGSSAELNLSFAKALVLLIAERQDLARADSREIVRLFLAKWRYVLTGRKEYPEAARDKWGKLERIATRTALHSEPGISGRKETSATDIEKPLLGDVRKKADEDMFDDLISWLLSPSVSDTAKSSLLRHYARWQPVLLWKLVRYSAVGAIVGDGIVMLQWCEWLGVETWLEMVSGVSLSLAETLRQVTGCISEKYGAAESVLSDGLLRFIVSYPAERAHYGEVSAIVRRYISGLGETVWKGGMPLFPIKQKTDEQIKNNGTDHIAFQDDSENGSLETGVFESVVRTSYTDDMENRSRKKTIAKEVESTLHIIDNEQLMEDAMEPKYVEVPNAGLCLLALWLPRLFRMLGLLTEDGKNLKDTEARIRAIFILECLVTDEMREYREQELAFSRILAGCPFQVPLPRTLKLTVDEIQVVESMLAGVKANWDKLKNSPIKSFQQAFIARPGRLEQQDGKWVLYVENRAYDILLDSLPWSYRHIRLPWLKKPINVVWREKEELDFEKS